MSNRRDIKVITSEFLLSPEVIDLKSDSVIQNVSLRRRCARLDIRIEMTPELLFSLRTLSRIPLCDHGVPIDENAGCVMCITGG